MSDLNPNTLALLRARANSARLFAADTHKSATNGALTDTGEILPFLDTCARELEEAAQLMRAAADAVASPKREGCSG